MSLKTFKNELKNNVNDFKSIKTIYRQIPNILTTSRIIAPIPINLLFFSGNIKGALLISALAFLTDAVDGPIARHLNISSQFGADLDAISDKLLIGGLAIPIVVQNPIMILNIALEGAISFTNIKAKLEGKNPKSSLIGKAKTWILSLTIIAGYLTSIFGLHISVLATVLALAPSLIAQSITLAKYIQTNSSSDAVIKTESENNNEHNNKFEDVYSNSKDKNAKKYHKEKKKEKMLEHKRKYIEELYKLKDELMNQNMEKSEDPEKEKGNAKSKTFTK